VGLSTDHKECVQVSLPLEDWAMLVTALATSPAPLEVKDRINSVIFDCARSTERVLS
jgi:hypothetical protein